MGQRIFQAQHHRGVNRHGGDITLEVFMERVYLHHAQIRKRSWRMDERIFRLHVSPVLGHRQLSKVEEWDIEDWLNALIIRGFAPASCNRFLAALKSVFALAEKRGFIVMSPCRRIRPFKTYAGRERYLSKKEARRLMASLVGNPRAQARAIRLILLTGARKNEILRARWDDVDFERQILTVPLSKSGKPRHIILSEMALELLREMAMERTGQWLFPGRHGDKPLNDIYDFWNALRQQMDLKDVRIHDLRHTFASLLVNSGHSLYEVQWLLGHQDPRTTMRYSHLGCDSLVAATEKVGSLLAGQA